MSAKQIDWAEVIAVMERSQLRRLKRQFGQQLGGKRLVCLDVPDRYEFVEPRLVVLLQSRFVRLTGASGPDDAD